jgi:hypothetical protein
MATYGGRRRKHWQTRKVDPATDHETIGEVLRFGVKDEIDEIRGPALTFPLPKPILCTG